MTSRDLASAPRDRSTVAGTAFKKEFMSMLTLAANDAQTYEIQQVEQ